MTTKHILKQILLWAALCLPPTAAAAVDGDRRARFAMPGQFRQAPAFDAGRRRERFVPEYVNFVSPDWPARRGAGDSIVIGDGDLIRAMSPFRGTAEARRAYADVVNRYQAAFGGRVNVYCMPIPTASAFYTPYAAASWTDNQRLAIIDIFSRLDDRVRAVDAFTALGRHAGEPIYLRTDHHWAPLGAYYAAEAFARAAGIDFPRLNSYARRVVAGFNGTMYRVTKDSRLKHASEDFVYYLPTRVNYTADHITYTVAKGSRVVDSRGPEPCSFFIQYRDGSGLAYNTFMGGDYNTTHVKTSTANGRRLLLLKDSFGNAIPGYLFHGFEDIHVVDCRYFLRNIVDYVAEHRITDILFCNNLSHVCSPAVARNYERFLRQNKRSPGPFDPSAVARDANDERFPGRDRRSPGPPGPSAVTRDADDGRSPWRDGRSLEPLSPATVLRDYERSRRRDEWPPEAPEHHEH